MKEEKELTFWEHLEELRWTIMRSAIVIITIMAAVFAFKGFVFDDIILAPKSGDFITYRFMCYLGELINMPSMCPGDFELQLINISLSGQFFMHMSVAFWLGVVLGFPYLIYELWRFVSPALYEHEKKNIGLSFVVGGFLFFMGVLVSYFIVFPLTVRFLGEYQVSETVANQIALSSYIDILTILSFCMGIVFEMPLLVYLLSIFGVITKAFMREYRRWAILINLVLAAVITPTSDPFTLFAVALPLMFLYEMSILVCKK